MILKHKPGSDISVNAYLNILYISHHELQQSMFLKSHLQHDHMTEIDNHFFINLIPHLCNVQFLFSFNDTGEISQELNESGQNWGHDDLLTYP